MLLKRLANNQLTIQRGLLRPPINIPFCGIYREDGETVRKGDLLVSQKRLNYHPGSGVHHVFDRGLHLLKSDCDGKVLITREPVALDMELDAIQNEYKSKMTTDLHKFHFNVVPLKMSNCFRLVDEV